MDTNKIEFCNKYVYNIKNNRLKSDILKKLTEIFQIKIISNNNDLYNQKKDLYTLQKYNHYLSTITSGNKYLLYLTTINNERYSILIDRKLSSSHKYPKMLIVNFRFSEKIFNNTIFECELIKDKYKKWTILLDSLIVYNNNKLTNNLLDNVSQMYTILEKNYYEDDSIQLCNIRVRKYFVYTELNYLINKFIPKSKYKIIGLLFHTVSLLRPNISLYFNTSDIPINYYKNNDLNFIKNLDSLKNASILEDKLLIQIKKEKELIESRKETIGEDLDFLKFFENDNNSLKFDEKLFTFLVKKDTELPNIYYLYDSKKKKIHKNSVARIDTLECSEFMKKIFENRLEYYLDCKYNKKFKKWIPENISHNKNLVDYYEIKKYIKNT